MSMVASYHEHTAAIWSLEWFSDNETIASASIDGTVRIWDIVAAHTQLVIDATTYPSGEVISHNEVGNEVEHISLSADDKLLLITNEMTRINVWDVETQEYVLQLPLPPEVVVYPVVAIWNPADSTIATRDPIALWNGITGENIRELGEYALFIAWSPDGRWLAASLPDETIRIWDATAGSEVAEFEGGFDTSEEYPLFYANTLAWSHDGTRLAGTDEHGMLHIWDTSALVTNE